MEANVLLIDQLERMQRALTTALDGLAQEEITWQPNPECNSIGFILWHQVRVEDLFVSMMLQGKPQVWESGKWAQKTGLPDNPRESGARFNAEQIGSFAVPRLQDLVDYGNAVRAETVKYLQSLPAGELDKIVETRIFGKMPVGQVLNHLLCEVTRHIGQIAYIRGLKRGLNK